MKSPLHHFLVRFGLVAYFLAGFFTYLPATAATKAQNEEYQHLDHNIYFISWDSTSEEQNPDQGKPVDSQPVEESESDEESKEKDGFEDDVNLNRLAYSSLSVKDNAHFLDHSVDLLRSGLKIPLFVLFHAWKYSMA